MPSPPPRPRLPKRENGTYLMLLRHWHVQLQIACLALGLIAPSGYVAYILRKISVSTSAIVSSKLRFRLMTVGKLLFIYCTRANYLFFGLGWLSGQYLSNPRSRLIPRIHSHNAPDNIPIPIMPHPITNHNSCASISPLTFPLLIMLQA